MSRSPFVERRHLPEDEAPNALALRPTRESPAPWLGPQAALLGLQARVGNSAVAGMLRAAPGTLADIAPSTRGLRLGAASMAPTAPVVSRWADEDAESEASSDAGGGGGESAEQSTDEAYWGGEEASSGESSGDASADAGQTAADAGEASSAETTPSAETASSEEGTSDEEAASSQEGSSSEEAGTDEAASEDAGGDSGEASAGAEASGGEEADGGEADAGAGAEADDGEHTAEEQAEKEAEGQTGPESDEFVDTSGGANPIAASATHASGSMAARFTDEGRTGTVPFTEAQLAGYDPAQDRQPHAFSAGGRTGTKAWAGGGGAGPKGNQRAGSIQNEVVPDYDSDWGGVFTNASAWVMEGTGIVDVTRNYVSSDAGDQGNGWWVSDKAAAALEAHEQRHVANSREQFDSKIGPVLDRIARSREIGKEITYKSSEAKAYVKQQIQWKAGLEAFKEADEANNAPEMLIDVNDRGSGALPRPMHGPRDIGGKTYDSYLIMNSEPDPT